MMLNAKTRGTRLKQDEFEFRRKMCAGDQIRGDFYSINPCLQFIALLKSSNASFGPFDSFIVFNKYRNHENPKNEFRFQ